SVWSRCWVASRGPWSRSSGAVRCGPPRGGAGARTRSRPRRQLRLVRARSSELERHPFAGEFDLVRPRGTELLRAREHAFQLPIRMEGVVVEEHEPLGPG